jgi:hypothetical protein
MSSIHCHRRISAPPRVAIWALAANYTAVALPVWQQARPSAAASISGKRPRWM